MAKLDKGTLALTFKFDCDRFLRFRLATEEELNTLGANAEKYKRPGIELISAAGRRWEADKYQDLIDTSRRGQVVYRQDAREEELLGRKPFKKIENLFDILQAAQPPQAIIEAEFVVPTNITPGLQEAYDQYGLEQVRVRPDILWIRPGGTGAPLIGNPSTPPEYEIHVIDVKMAAEPSLRHFTEVTYYALALAALIQQVGLSLRYGVSAEGLIWPGNHDINAFRNLVQTHTAKGAIEPVTEALKETLIPVPYEVYVVHVKQFFEERLLRVLDTQLQDAQWHVGLKCQLCDYVRFCRQQASDCDHLSRLAWLNQGQAELLRNNGIYTTQDLVAAISIEDERWTAVKETSHQLRADGPALAVRARALTEGIPLPVEGRRSSMIPAWTDQSIFITVHFDPGSGISFALGAARVYFSSDRKRGNPPVTEEKIFIVDRVEAMNPGTERERLKEFASVVSGWMLEVSDLNRQLPAKDRLKSHIFFWDLLEVRQLRRMLERHIKHSDVIELIEVFTRFFPPENMLPDPDAYKSQPGTVVKEVLRTLVGVPVAHDYSLFEVANSFYPFVKDDGSTYKFDLPFGFATDMSDQIPFERAYELWQDKIFVRHFDPRYPDEPKRWRRYTRDELYDGLKNATKMHLHALQFIVRRLREYYRELLRLKKSGFSAAPSRQASVPEKARSLIAFEKLNVACQEIENRNIRSLPVDEREAHFFSIRGMRLKSEAEANLIIDEIKSANPQYRYDTFYVFDFAPTSRDARIKEGEFTLAISNEATELDLDQPWRHYMGLSFSDAEALLVDSGLGDKWMVTISLGRLLEVQVIRLEAMQEAPFIVLKPNHHDLFQFAMNQGIVDLSSSLVLDPVFRDFSSDRIEMALRTVGGKAAPVKRTKKRR